MSGKYYDRRPGIRVSWFGLRDSRFGAPIHIPALKIKSEQGRPALAALEPVLAPPSRLRAVLLNILPCGPRLLGSAFVAAPQPPPRFALSNLPDFNLGRHVNP